MQVVWRVLITKQVPGTTFFNSLIISITSILYQSYFCSIQRLMHCGIYISRFQGCPESTRLFQTNGYYS